MIQIRNVPEDLHRRLKAKAAMEGISLSELLLREATLVAEIMNRLRTATSSEVVPSDLQGHLDQQEREILVKVLKDSSYNRTLAAHRLGLSLRQIRYRIARLKIDLPTSRDDPPDD